MARPFCCRRVSGQPPSRFFKPQGVPLVELEIVTMTVDEYEAVRLADLEGLYQEDAARRMGVSRQTFGRIVESAHRKMADALAHARALEIKGGEIEMVSQREFQCTDCRHRWQVPFGTARPAACPECQSRNIFRADSARGRGNWGRGGLGRGAGAGMHHRRCRRGGGPSAHRQGGNV
jgi:predicted DNA-binding protein (UPF0251 family)